MYKCTWCGIEYKPKGYSTEKNTKKRFCSRLCYNEWLRINAHKRLPKDVAGSKNPRYIEGAIRHKKCEWCGEEFSCRNAYVARLKTKRFCSNKCRREWYSRVWSQRDEWRDEKREMALQQLNNGVRGRTKPEKICYNILKDLDFEFEEEKIFGNFAVDFFIPKTFIIEVMGGFYHCDARKYKEITYKMQEVSIVRDKAKRSYLINNYGINPLYLWEDDLYNRKDVCIKLIEKYIATDGHLDSYHSSDYYIIGDSLLISCEKTIHYMDMVIEVMRDFRGERVKKESKKDLSKWHMIECSYCGVSFERLISKTLEKNNFCSNKCSSESRKK